MSATRSALLIPDTKFFFHPGDLSRQATDVGVKLGYLFVVSCSFLRQLRVLFFEETGQPFQCVGFPFADEIGVNLVSRGDLRDELVSPKDLLDDLGLEGGSVVFPHLSLTHVISASSSV